MEFSRISWLSWNSMYKLRAPYVHKSENWIKSVDLIWKTTEYTRTFGVVSRKLSKPKKMDSNPRKSWKGRADGRHATKQLTTAHKSAND